MSIADVARHVGYSRSTVLRLCKAREFPAPLRIQGLRRVVWLRDIVDEWLDRRAGGGKAPVLDGWDV